MIDVTIYINIFWRILRFNQKLKDFHGNYSEKS